eukprot:6211994-Prymnesium_polylepis.1
MPGCIGVIVPSTAAVPPPSHLSGASYTYRTAMEALARVQSLVTNGLCSIIHGMKPCAAYFVGHQSSARGNGASADEQCG